MEGHSGDRLQKRPGHHTLQEIDCTACSKVKSAAELPEQI